MGATWKTHLTRSILTREGSNLLPIRPSVLDAGFELELAATAREFLT